MRRDPESAHRDAIASLTRVAGRCEVKINTALDTEVSLTLAVV